MIENDDPLCAAQGLIANLQRAMRAYRDAGEVFVIRNDAELAVMRERLASFENVLEALRKTARPEEWPALSSGYRLEIERMQGEILDYLVRGAPDESPI